MSKSESEPSVPGPESPAAAGEGADPGVAEDPGTDGGPGADGERGVTAAAAPAAPAPTAGQDPRVDFRKDTAEPASPPVPASPAGSASPPAPAAPADPWAAPDLSAGPSAAPAPAPRAVPPSAAPPQPPYPLPAGGWASVTPAARSGFPPGHPYAQPPGQGPAAAPFPGFVPGPAPTNGFAVGSLVTGLLLVAPVALVFGILALVQINRRKERGSGMAVTGLVLGTVGTVLLVLALGAADFGSARAGRFGGAPKAPAGSVHWSDLKAGDCYDSPGGGSTSDGNGDETVYWVHRVACAEPHNGEVAGTADLPGRDGGYPGESEVRDSAGRLCRQVLDGYALDQWVLPDGMDDVYLYPTARNWESGARYVTCAYEDREEQHRGTVRTDRSSLTAPQLAYLEAVRSFNDVYLDPPAGAVSESEAEYRAWARRMAAASRAQAAALGGPSVPWPADVQPKIVKLAEATSQAAAAWDAAASGGDVAGDVRRARALVAKSAPTALEVRRGLGLSTGEQVPDLRV